jgi:hypothetical protein
MLDFATCTIEDALLSFFKDHMSFDDAIAAITTGFTIANRIEEIETFLSDKDVMTGTVLGIISKALS